MMMVRSTLALATPAFALLLSAVASAQDFGTSWIDRVTHELIEDDGPLDPHPVVFKFSVGELYTYDTNIFLTHAGRTSDSIFTTFAGADLQFAQPDFDAEADLTVNYNIYAKTSTADADEERFFGRVRYQGSMITLQIAEIFRRENSPTDVTFTTRVGRLLSNTTPLVVYKFSEVASLEAQSDVQLVRYMRQFYQIADNFNTRSTLTGAYTTGWNNLDALLQFGYLTIDYTITGAPPDASGYFGRLGLRGEISPNLHLIALIGFTRATSSAPKSQLSTADAEVHLAYTVSERITAYADYSRRFGFSTGGSPFEVVDSADAVLRYSLTEPLALKARLQYDLAHPVIGPVRSYASASAGAEYRLLEHLRVEGQLGYRYGTVQQVVGGTFGDTIISVGIVGVF